MAQVTIAPGRLSGTVAAPPSKSAAHRGLILAALCQGVSTVTPVDLSDDVSATLTGIAALGTHCQRHKEGVRVTGAQLPPAALPLVDCRESGSTLRFLLPAALVLAGGAHFVGRGRLGQRPMKPYEDICRRQGIAYEIGHGGGLDLRVEGRLRSGEFILPGDVSSQFVSGLLMALPRLPGDSLIRLTGKVESVGYIRQTIQAMRAFSLEVEARDEGTYRVPGGQRYRPALFQVEGDYSQAAVFLCAGALGSSLWVKGLSGASVQGDQAVLEHLMRMGAGVSRDERGLQVQAGPLAGACIDGSQCPDIVPILALVCALARGESRIVGAARLRLKESDRLAATCQELNRLGGRVEQTGDGLIIQGVESLEGGVICDCHGDHRIAMLLAVAALRCRRPVTLDGVECLSKSYPRFLEDFRQLGGEVHGWNMG